MGYYCGEWAVGWICSRVRNDTCPGSPSKKEYQLSGDTHTRMHTYIHGCTCTHAHMYVRTYACTQTSHTFHTPLGIFSFLRAWTFFAQFFKQIFIPVYGIHSQARTWFHQTRPWPNVGAAWSWWCKGHDTWWPKDVPPSMGRCDSWRQRCCKICVWCRSSLVLGLDCSCLRSDKNSWKVSFVAKPNLWYKSHSTWTTCPLCVNCHSLFVVVVVLYSHPDYFILASEACIGSEGISRGVNLGDWSGGNKYSHSVIEVWHMINTAFCSTYYIKINSSNNKHRSTIRTYSSRAFTWVVTLSSFTWQFRIGSFLFYSSLLTYCRKHISVWCG